MSARARETFSKSTPGSTRSLTHTHSTLYSQPKPKHQRKHHRAPDSHLPAPRCGFANTSSAHPLPLPSTSPTAAAVPATSVSPTLLYSTHPTLLRCTTAAVSSCKPLHSNRLASHHIARRSNCFAFTVCARLQRPARRLRFDPAV